MLKIWGRANSINVHKVLWALAELEIDYERIDAGLQYGQVDQPWFAAMNPNRTVPVLEEDGFFLWESNAILRYLVERDSQGRLRPEGLKERAKADQWCDWLQTTVMSPLGPLFLGLVRTPAEERDATLLQTSNQAVSRAMTILDQALSDKAYILGEDFTFADIPLGCAAYRCFALERDFGGESCFHTWPGFEKWPHLSRWQDSLRRRPAFAEYVMLPLT